MLCILLEYSPGFRNSQLIPLSTTSCFNINHHDGGLYQPYSDKLNLQCNIAVTAVFLFPDTSIYPTLESSTAEPAKSDGPGTAGAIKSDISNGKVNSVFQMHFREDGGGRGFRHWKWQRLAPSHWLWNAFMNFTLFPVITNKQEVLPRGCLWHTVRSEHPLHLQSTDESSGLFWLCIYSKQTLIGAAISPVSVLLQNIDVSRRIFWFLFWQWQKPSRKNNVNIIYVSGVQPVTQYLVSCFPLFIRVLLTTIYS